MLFRPSLEEGDIQARIDRAAVVTPDLMADIVSHCRRVDRSATSPISRRLRELVDVHAWTEAALALIEMELPRWSLARLVLDEGEWMCTLSRHPQMPAWLDEVVDGRHPSMPLAILAAAIMAHDADLHGADALTRSVPAAPRQAEALCCDNFA